MNEKELINILTFVQRVPLTLTSKVVEDIPGLKRFYRDANDSFERGLGKFHFKYDHIDEKFLVIGSSHMVVLGGPHSGYKEFSANLSFRAIPDYLISMAKNRFEKALLDLYLDSQQESLDLMAEAIKTRCLES